MELIRTLSDFAVGHQICAAMRFPRFSFRHVIMGWDKVAYTLAELSGASRSCDRFGSLDDGSWRLDSCGESLASAEVISLHIPLTTTTKKAFNAEIISQLRNGVKIISDAVGVIDEEALLEALDNGVVAKAVFTEEPSKLDDKLAGHKNVTVTPHPLASMRLLAQEGVAMEVAQEVLSALQGDIPLSTINARGFYKEVLERLAPYIPLAEKLGRFMQLATIGSAVKSVQVSYRFKDGVVCCLERRLITWSPLLRPMIIKGLTEPNSRTNVNFVNADYVAKQQGLVITEEWKSGKEESSVDIEGSLESIQVKIAQVEPMFSRALLSDSDEIAFEEEDNVGISFMIVTARKTSSKQALMSIRVEDEPSVAVLQRIEGIQGVEEVMFVNL
ncbi:hypothetical protein GOP47_0002756 [Adiantum capillus-veneris]|uniref:phosphoglycerate dehydrogenase n=1 Tax=Adiantum capillus-veneris TaxID=13818 RepID=A0A9D4VCE4_ADICA|nr:hypothetical protein GOP47_0002756 [Adiantum capillus-veneris]